MFIEVLIIDSLNKTPIAFNTIDQYNYNYYLTFEISDPSGQKLSSNYAYAQNSTATFTYKVPSDAVGGEYLITVYNNYIACTKKLIRIRDYPRDQLVVKALLSLESYRPGDTVSGQLSVSQPDGEAFTKAPTYSYSINFNASSVNIVN